MIGGVDLSARRIMASADVGDIITDNAVISELDGWYLMQFEDAETLRLLCT